MPARRAVSPARCERARDEQREIAAHRRARPGFAAPRLGAERRRGSPRASAKSCRPRIAAGSAVAGIVEAQEPWPAAAQCSSSADAFVGGHVGLEAAKPDEPGCRSRTGARRRNAIGDSQRRRADDEKLRFVLVHASIAPHDSLRSALEPAQSRELRRARAFVNPRAPRPSASRRRERDCARAVRPRRRAPRGPHGPADHSAARRRRRRAHDHRRRRRAGQAARARWSPRKAGGSPANCRRSAAC